MAATWPGWSLGMELLEPGFAVAPASGPPRVGRVRVPAAPEIDDAVTRVLREASWGVTDVDPADWLTATKWTLPPLVAEAYRSNRDIVDRDADRLTPGVTQRMIAGREVTPARRRRRPRPGTRGGLSWPRCSSASTCWLCPR